MVLLIRGGRYSGWYVVVVGRFLCYVGVWWWLVGGVVVFFRVRIVCC